MTLNPLSNWLRKIPYPKLLVKRLYFKSLYKARVETPLISFDTVLDVGVTIKAGSVIRSSKIGRYSYLNYGVEAYSSNIASFCSLGQFCQIGPNEHLLKYITTCEALYSPKVLNIVNQKNKTRTDIGPDVWIGSRAIVLKGRKVGVGAVVAAGAVVTKDVPPYAITAGIPAKVIHYRFSAEEIALLVKSEWWKIPVKYIEEILQQVDYLGGNCDVEQFCHLVNKRYLSH